MNVVRSPMLDEAGQNTNEHPTTNNAFEALMAVYIRTRMCVHIFRLWDSVIVDGKKRNVLNWHFQL